MVDVSTLKTLVSKDTILNSLNNAWKTVLFMEALRNLNWSRGYCWYAELDGVPSPFQRGGVLGLPATSISFNLANSSSQLSIASGTMQTQVPQGCGDIDEIQLTVLDDEQGTLRQFFERWHNQVYNPYLGVLPVTEACKQLTIYYQKSTRRNVKRVSYSIDTTISNSNNKILNYAQTAANLTGDAGMQQMVNQAQNIQSTYNNVQNAISKLTGSNISQHISDGIDFLVFPTSSLQINLLANATDLLSFTVTLHIAQFINQDFGNPTVNNGVKTLLDTVIGQVSNGNSFLDKLADYI